MSVKIDEAEQLGEFLQEDVISFRADFKAMVPGLGGSRC
jgi:hypothetical protein